MESGIPVTLPSCTTACVVSGLRAPAALSVPTAILGRLAGNGILLSIHPIDTKTQPVSAHGFPRPEADAAGFAHSAPAYLQQSTPLSSHEAWRISGGRHYPNCQRLLGTTSGVRSRAPVVRSGAPVVLSGAPVVRSGAPIVWSGAPIVWSGAPFG